VRWRRGKGGSAERQIEGLDRATTLGQLAQRDVEALVNRCAVRWRRGKGGPTERQIQGLDGATTFGDLAQRNIEALVNRCAVRWRRGEGGPAQGRIRGSDCSGGGTPIVRDDIGDRGDLPGGERGYHDQGHGNQDIEYAVS
jgi:hypothetical protein